MDEAIAEPRHQQISPRSHTLDAGPQTEVNLHLPTLQQTPTETLTSDLCRIPVCIYTYLDAVHYDVLVCGPRHNVDITSTREHLLKTENNETAPEVRYIYTIR